MPDEIDVVAHLERGASGRIESKCPGLIGRSSGSNAKLVHQ
jgi:hypothetical protein